MNSDIDTALRGIEPLRSLSLRLCHLTPRDLAIVTAAAHALLVDRLEPLAEIATRLDAIDDRLIEISQNASNQDDSLMAISESLGEVAANLGDISHADPLN